MNPTIYLSCLVVIIGSFSWTAIAQGDQEFQSELQRLNNIYGNDAVHRVTKLRNIPELMAFYEKYSERIQLTEAERQEADRALRQYKERNQRREEGLTPQGCVGSDWLTAYNRYGYLISIITKALEEAQNKH